MISASDLRNGTAFLHDGKPHKVLKYTFIKMGRGGATVRVLARDLISGSVVEKTFSSSVKVEEAKTTKRTLQYLYQDGANVVFMDPSNYEQLEVQKDVLENELPYIKEGETVTVVLWEDKVLGVDIPPKVILKVAETDPGVRGNSASNMYKSAVLENGISVRVPLFVEKGDKVRVDTRTGEYVERVKE
ncbi:MAG: elongation factor P [Patescibacteria group bacterium]|nr:elongation factor P [Patescibacteria group bacterium]